MAAAERALPTPSLGTAVLLLLVLDVVNALNNSPLGPIRGLGGFLFPDALPWFGLGLLNLALLAVALWTSRDRLGNLGSRLETALPRLARLPGRLSRFGAGPGRPLALGLLGLGLALVALPQLGLRVQRPLPISSAQPTGGFGYAVALSGVGPSDYEPLAGSSSLVLLEDGQPLARPHTDPAAVSAEGGGRYQHGRGRLVFAASDGSDPRTNGRSYQVDAPWAPPAWLLALAWLPAVCLNAVRLRRLALGAAMRPGASAIGVALVCLVWRLQAATGYDGDLPGWMAHGVPVSDADSWNSMAWYLSLGLPPGEAAGGWDARRPLYYVVLGAVYAVTGDSLWAARLLNIVLDVVASVCIVDGVRRVAPYPVALVCALAFATHPVAARLALTTLTEPLGHALATGCVWALAVGLQRLAQGGPTRRWVTFAGVLFALSNLARPVSLFATPLLAALPLAVLTRAQGRRGVPRGLLLGGLFVLGFALTLSPWLIRQRLRYGILALSDNGHEALLAAASPEYGTWVPEISLLAGPVDLPERIAYYREHARAAVLEHTGFWLRNAAKHARDAVVALVPPRGWWLALALAFPLLAARPSSRPPPRAVAVGALGAALALACVPYVRILAWLAAGLALCVRPRPLTALALLLAGTLAAVGLLAMNSALRLLYSLDWLITGLSAWLWLGVLVRWGGSLAPELAEAPPWSPAARRRLRGLLGLTALLVSFAFGLLITRQVWPRPPAPVAPLTEAERAQLLAQVFASAGSAPYTDLADALDVQIGRPRAEYVFWTDGRIALHPWQQLFQPRPFGYTHVKAVPPLRYGPDEQEAHGALFPARIPSAWLEEPLAFVGVGVDEGSFSTVLHLIAVARRRADGWELRLPPPDVAARHAEALREALAHARPAFELDPPR